MSRKSGLKRMRSLPGSRQQVRRDLTNRLQEDISCDDDGVNSEESHIPKKQVRWDGAAESHVDEIYQGEEDRPESEETSETKICFTVLCQNGRIGCSYYDPVKCFVYVLEDTQESLHFDLTTMLLEQCNPDIVLTSSRADDKFITILQNYMEASGGIFQIRPHKEFIPNKGRDRLLSLRLLSELDTESHIQAPSEADSNSEARNAYDFMNKRREITGDPVAKRWNAAIRLSNFTSLDSAPLCISSIGALLDHLNRERAVVELNDLGIDGLEVRGIEGLTLDQAMQINADALFSLQVFEDENHASIHSDKTKEGLSLFGTLDNTQTTLGRSLLKTWLLRPSLSLSVINARHDAVECFIRPENLVPVNAMQVHLKGIKNVPRILGNIRMGKAGITEWQGLVKFTFHSAMLRDALAEVNEAGDVEIVNKLIAALDVASFKEIGNTINETIDWEESAQVGQVCVRPHIDEELDQRKHVYNGIDTILSKVAEQISQTTPAEYASSLNVVYFPQLGFLICVPMLELWQTEGIKVLDGWSFQFSSESYVYFKSQEMRDMDTHIGDIHPSIVDRELEIVQALQEKVLVYDQVMGQACDVCAELDCLLSFAAATRAFDYRKPRIVERSVVHIKQGRHPLQEQVVDIFVRNDAHLVAGAGFDFVESNCANACGKSVYLKQVALIQYMAQIGCYVPAEAATLGIVDKIFTRVQTRESVSKVQSAFMIDLNQVSLALRNCTARSLILLDEFGKGTVSTDGAGLFCGVLKHLLDRGVNCPMVLAATHFHEVFRKDLLDAQSLPITLLHMQVLFASSPRQLVENSSSTWASSPIYDGIEDESMEDGDNDHKIIPGKNLTYLYRVAPGLSLNSHAAQCAAIFGIPRRIVQRAQYVSQLLSSYELGKLLDEDMTEDERRDLQNAEDICRNFLEWDLQSDEATRQFGVKGKLAEVLGRKLQEE